MRVSGERNISLSFLLSDYKLQVLKPFEDFVFGSEVPLPQIVKDYKIVVCCLGFLLDS